MGSAESFAFKESVVNKQGLGAFLPTVRTLQRPFQFLCNTREEEGAILSSTLPPKDLNRIFLLLDTMAALKVI